MVLAAPFAMLAVAGETVPSASLVNVTGSSFSMVGLTGSPLEFCVTSARSVDVPPVGTLEGLGIRRSFMYGSESTVPKVVGHAADEFGAPLHPHQLFSAVSEPLDALYMAVPLVAVLPENLLRLIPKLVLFV